MRRIVKLIIIINILVQFSYAQTVKTVVEFNAVVDSIQQRLDVAEKEFDSLIGKPFSELVTLLEKCDIKIYQVSVSQEDRFIPHKLALGITLWLTSQEHRDFAFRNNVWGPTIFVLFTDGKPSEESLRVTRESGFTKEMEEFFADAEMKYLFINSPEKQRRRVLENQK